MGDLTVKNLMDRISICESLLKRNEIESFFKWFITDNEKWITYDNNVCSRSKVKLRKRWQSQNWHQKKLCVCVCICLCVCMWWDWKGIVHCCCPIKRLILTCQQLKRLHQAIERKQLELINRKDVIFHQCNARPRTSLATRQNWGNLIGKF